jgi:hypothetical protein
MHGKRRGEEYGYGQGFESTAEGSERRTQVERHGVRVKGAVRKDKTGC